MTPAQTILITGAGSGIGKACAEAFLDAGWRVGLIGRLADDEWVPDVPETTLARANKLAAHLPHDPTAY